MASGYRDSLTKLMPAKFRNLNMWCVFSTFRQVDLERESVCRADLVEQVDLHAVCLELAMAVALSIGCDSQGEGVGIDATS